jgi:hypothetical protein
VPLATKGIIRISHAKLVWLIYFGNTWIQNRVKRGLSGSDIPLSLPSHQADLALHYQTIKPKQMKKIAFALQVLSLIMILPVYLFLEMNHPLP